MRINVKVIANAKKDAVEDAGGELRVHLRAPAVEGKANRALTELLARHYNVKKKDIRIVRGEKSRLKVVEVGGA